MQSIKRIVLSFRKHKVLEFRDLQRPRSLDQHCWLR